MRSGYKLFVLLDVELFCCYYLLLLLFLTGINCCLNNSNKNHTRAHIYTQSTHTEHTHTHHTHTHTRARARARKKHSFCFVVLSLFWSLVCFVASDILTTICHLAIVNVCVIIILSIGNTQISILLLCFLYLFVELMITMKEHNLV